MAERDGSGEEVESFRRFRTRPGTKSVQSHNTMVMETVYGRRALDWQLADDRAFISNQTIFVIQYGRFLAVFQLSIIRRTLITAMAALICYRLHDTLRGRVPDDLDEFSILRSSGLRSTGRLTRETSLPSST